MILLGASSGIGLATARFFSKHGSKIVAADLNPLPEDLANTTYRKVDLTKWNEQFDLFQWTANTFGHIDIAFLNAGVGEIEDVFVDKFDEQGRLKEPEYKVLAVNLIAPINGTKIAIHFMKKQKEPGSIVITGSGKCKSSTLGYHRCGPRKELITLPRLQRCGRHPHVRGGQARCKYHPHSKWCHSLKNVFGSFWDLFGPCELIFRPSSIYDSIWSVLFGPIRA